MADIFSILDIRMPMSETYRLLCNRYGSGHGPRVAIVAGIHGDEFNGIGVCYQLTSYLNDLERTNPLAITGIVDILPAVNAIALDSGGRYWPSYDADLNRRFPGNPEGSPPHRAPAALLDFLSGSDVCLDIHASNIYLQEASQVRMLDRFAPDLTPLAEHLNLQLIWVHAASTVLETTLSYNLNSRGTRTLVVEMGIGLRYEDEICTNLFGGILTLLKTLGVLSGIEVPDFHVGPPALTAHDHDVRYYNARRSGFFIPSAPLWEPVNPGDLIGRITNPLSGTILEEIRSEDSGRLFTTRPFPMVYEGSLCGRLLLTSARGRTKGK